MLKAKHLVTWVVTIIKKYITNKEDNMYNYNATCVKVVDGDTIDAEIDLGFDIKIKKRIRLAGINAPESRTRNLAEKKMGLASKDRLIELLDGAANCFELESTEIGKYGRVPVSYTHLRAHETLR